MPVISLRDDSIQLHTILPKEALCPVSLNAPQGSSDVCTSLGGSVETVNGLCLWAGLCTEVILTVALCATARAFAFSISASRGNQLTGLPAFSLNYATQVMTGRGPLWRKKRLWNTRGCLHPCIIHLAELKGGNKTISLFVFFPPYPFFDGALVWWGGIMRWAQTRRERGILLSSLLLFVIRGGRRCLRLRLKTHRRHPGQPLFFFLFVFPFMLGLCSCQIMGNH